jgi:hypothetical protein
MRGRGGSEGDRAPQSRRAHPLIAARGRPGTALACALAAAVVVAALPAATAASPEGVTVIAQVGPAIVSLGSPAVVSGSVRDAGAAVPGAALVLERSPYPYRSESVAGRTRSGADGTFAFAPLVADRNTRLRVVLEGGAASSPALDLAVDPRVALAARSLGPGRERLTLRVRHVPWRAAPTEVRWFLRAAGSSLYVLAAATGTSEPRAGLSAAEAVVDPPSRRFSYRVCLNPPWEAAMGPPADHGRCPTGAFRESVPHG